MGEKTREEKTTSIALVILGVAVAAAGLARGFGLGESRLQFDDTTLLYLAVGGALILLPRVQSLAFRDFKLELKEAKERAGEAQAEAAKAREDAGRAFENATRAAATASGAEDVALATAQHALSAPSAPAAAASRHAVVTAPSPDAGAVVVDTPARESPTPGVVSVQTSDLLETAAAAKRPGTAPDDPWKGVFGGSAEARGRRLSATVKPLSGSRDYCVVHLIVEPTGSRRITGDVVFFLHPTFPRERVRVPVDDDGKAELRLFAWGAFTVGALCDDGRTQVELDLATLPDAPIEFKER